MGLFDRFTMKTKTKTCTLAACTAGTVVPMEQIADPVFAEGILGPCAGIEPEEGLVVSPSEGVITQVAEGLHAIGLRTPEEAEVLVHVGIDTVQMVGEGFRVLASEGDQVHLGQPLITFDRDKIRAAGYKDTVMIAVTNGDRFEGVSLTASAQVRAGEPLLIISR